MMLLNMTVLNMLLLNMTVLNIILSSSSGKGFTSLLGIAASFLEFVVRAGGLVHVRIGGLFVGTISI